MAGTVGPFSLLCRYCASLPYVLECTQGPCRESAVEAVVLVNLNLKQRAKRKDIVPMCVCASCGPCPRGPAAASCRLPPRQSQRGRAYRARWALLRQERKDTGWACDVGARPGAAPAAREQWQRPWHSAHRTGSPWQSVAFGCRLA